MTFHKAMLHVSKDANFFKNLQLQYLLQKFITQKWPCFPQLIQNLKGVSHHCNNMHLIKCNLLFILHLCYNYYSFQFPPQICSLTINQFEQQYNTQN